MGNLPKVAKADDVVLKSVLEVDTELVRGIIPAGTAIKKVRIIAGCGTSTGFRAAEELSAKIGGIKEKWQKKGGIAQTNNFIYDIHWNEYEGIQYASKLKGVKLRK